MDSEEFRTVFKPENLRLTVDGVEIPCDVSEDGVITVPSFEIPSTYPPRCPECGWLYQRVTPADGQCECRDLLDAELIYEDILDAEVIGD